MKEKVTGVQIVPIKPKDGLVAFASFTFDNNFYFSSVGIYTRPRGGYRLTYPTHKAAAVSYPIFHPINKLIAGEIEAAVINKYEEIVSGGGLAQ